MRRGSCLSPKMSSKSFPKMSLSSSGENTLEDKAKKEEKIYVWKRGIALEEQTVVRENQAKIDALYPKTLTKEGKESSSSSSSSSSSLYHRRRRVDARDILRRTRRRARRRTR